MAWSPNESTVHRTLTKMNVCNFRTPCSLIFGSKPIQVSIGEPDMTKYYKKHKCQIYVETINEQHQRLTTINELPGPDMEHKH